VLRKGGTIIDINPAENPFSELARRSPGGAVIPLPSGRLLPEMLRVMQQAIGGRRHT
jgi:hypothetical protein